MIRTITDMTIANDVFYGVVVKEAFRTEVFPGSVYHCLEAGHWNRDVVFVCLTLFRYGLRDTLSDSPQLRELYRRLREDAGVDERLLSL